MNIGRNEWPQDSGGHSDTQDKKKGGIVISISDNYQDHKIIWLKISSSITCKLFDLYS